VSASPHKRLKAFRQERGLSKTSLAKLIGCDESYISHVESGRRRLGLAFAHELESLSADWVNGPIRAVEWIPRGKDAAA